MDVRRVAELHDPQQRTGGTGYLIGEDLILTAHHVIAPINTSGVIGTHYHVRFIGDYDQGKKEWIKEGCYLCWDDPDPDRDLALLKLVGGRPAFLASHESSDIRFGKLGYETLLAKGTGFPTVQVIENRSNPEPLRGNLSRIAGMKEQQLRLEVTSPVPKQADEWQGISGTALFVEDFLIGVIVQTNKSFAEKALWATPLSIVANDAKFCQLVSGRTDAPLHLIDVEKVDQIEEPEPPLRQKLKAAGLASLVAAICVISIRTLGWLQPLELGLYDQFMKLRPEKSWDDRIAIVQITKSDQEEGLSEIPNQKLKNLLQNLVDHYKPRVVGLDIYSDVPLNNKDPDYKNLAEYIQIANSKKPQIITICRGTHEKSEQGRNPFLGVNSKHTGFNDVISDDKKFPSMVRRQLVQMQQADNSPCKAKQSLSYLVAKQYLAGDGSTLDWDNDGYLFLENKKQNKKIYSDPLQGRTVGYQNYDSKGYQLLLNYRNSVSPGYAPEILSFSQINPNESNVDKIKDKIVLIGYGDESKQTRQESDLLNTPIGSDMPGVVLHAHMVSQLINLDRDPLIWYLSQASEITLIFTCALISGATTLFWRNRHPFYIGIGTAIIPTILASGICFIFFLNAGWLPLGPFIVVSLGTNAITVGVLKKKYLLKQISALKAGGR